MTVERWQTEDQHPALPTQGWSCQMWWAHHYVHKTPSFPLWQGLGFILWTHKVRYSGSCLSSVSLPVVLVTHGQLLSRSRQPCFSSEMCSEGQQQPDAVSNAYILHLNASHHVGISSPHIQEGGAQDSKKFWERNYIHMTSTTTILW